MSSPRAEPWEGSGCSSLRSEGRKNVLGKEERERGRRKKWGGKRGGGPKRRRAPEFGGGGGAAAAAAAAAAALPRTPAPRFGEGRQLAICQICRCILPPPPPRFPPPCSSRRLPPSSPKPAASTDLSNGCTFLGAGRGVAERLNRGSKARGSERATPARRAPRQPAAWRAGRGGVKAELGGARRTAPLRCPGAIPAPGSHPWRSGQRCPHPPGPGPPSLPPAGNRGPAADPAGARRRWGLPGRYRVNYSSPFPGGRVRRRWGVKNANLSPYSLTDPAKPLRTPGPPGGWRKVARGSLDPPLRLCKVAVHIENTLVWEKMQLTSRGTNESGITKEQHLSSLSMTKKIPYSESTLNTLLDTTLLSSEIKQSRGISYFKERRWISKGKGKKPNMRFYVLLSQYKTEKSAFITFSNLDFFIQGDQTYHTTVSKYPLIRRKGIKVSLNIYELLFPHLQKKKVEERLLRQPCLFHGTGGQEPEATPVRAGDFKGWPAPLNRHPGLGRAKRRALLRICRDGAKGESLRSPQAAPAHWAQCTRAVQKGGSPRPPPATGALPHGVCGGEVAQPLTGGLKAPGPRTKEQTLCCDQARFQLFTPLAAILAGRADPGRGLLPAPPPPRGQGLTPHPGLLRRLKPLTPVSFRCQGQLCSEWRKCAEEPGYAWL
eukprot:bmy_04364T0